MAEVAAVTGQPRREVYQRALALAKERGDDADLNDRAHPGPSGRRPAPERQVAFRTGISAESRAAALLIAKGFRIWRGAGAARSARSTSSRAAAAC